MLTIIALGHSLLPKHVLHTLLSILFMQSQLLDLLVALVKSTPEGSQSLCELWRLCPKKLLAVILLAYIHVYGTQVCH